MSGDTFEFDDKNHAERFVGTLHDPAATTGDVLTVQADKSITAAPGGGGSGGVQVVTVPVSSAQILDLANTDVTLVVGVPGSAIVVVGATIVYLPGAVPYLDPGGSLYVVTDESGGAQALWSNAEPGQSLWDQATPGIYPQIAVGNATILGTAGLDGADVALTYSGGVSPTLGDGTLLVTVSYFLAPTV